MTTPAYDVIVVGLGAMGSAAAYQVAARGRRVLGLDTYHPGHEHGSSHGRTRIIREAYYEAPEYVPLARRSLALWHELAALAERPLFTRTGGLCFGAPETDMVAGTLASARQFGIAHEYLPAAEVNARFPAYRLDEGQWAVYEPGAGLLAPEDCIAAYLEQATAQGAELRHGEPVRRWLPDGDGVRVETDRGSYRAARLVLAAGPWSGELLADLGLPLELWRIMHVHFEPDAPERFGVGRCPWSLWEIPEGIYTAFTAMPGDGVKTGRHDVGEPCTIDSVRREIDPAEVEDLRRHLNRYLPGAGGGMKWALTCLYTVTPDHHFVIDRHPEYPQVSYACGFSGHGFKFAPVVGEILADLALEGATSHEIRLFAAGRFSG